MMIAAVAMAGMMCSCGDKAAGGKDADSTKVEAAEGDKAAEAAPASDKPMKEQMKDAIANIKTACEDEDFDAFKKGFIAYAEAIKSASSLEELMSLDKEPDLDIEKALAGVKDPEKWCTPEQKKELEEELGPKLEEAMTEVMKKFVPAMKEAAEGEAEEAAEEAAN